MNAYMNQYQNNQTLTATPEQILIQLYDGAIRFVRQAKMALDEGRGADKAKAISKAVAIVTTFSNTLNREVGGEIAEELSRLYDFILRELSEVNSSNDAAKLAPVEKILLDLREAFVGAAELNRQGAQAAPASPNSPYAPSPQNAQQIQATGEVAPRSFAASC